VSIISYFFIPFLTLYSGDRALAAPSLESIPEALPYYRNQHSLLTSGYANSKNLANTFIRSESEHSYEVLWDKKSYKMQPKEILLEIMMAQKGVTLISTGLQREPKSTSAIVIKLKPNTLIEILDSQDQWIKARVPNTEIVGWILVSNLRSETFHTGKMISLIDTFLKKEPSDSSKILTTIPRLKDILPMGVLKDWVKVSYQGLIGYVPIQNFALRADFCNWAYEKNQKKWIAIKYRQGAHLVTHEGERVPLDQFIGFYPQPQLGISISSQDHLPPLRAHLFITKINQLSWNVSFLTGHGEVWWKPKSSSNTSEVQRVSSQSAETLTTDELFKRKINSYAFNETTTIKGLISSSGIYITKDGLTWKQLKDFKSENHPVSISKQGILYVGSYRSLDQGNTFQNYIRWDKLTGLIQNNLKRTPRTLKLEEIQSRHKQEIELLINTGSQKIKVSGNSQSNSWSIVK